jgi:hypothetical protein
MYTGVPRATLRYIHMMSAACMRMQPWLADLPIDAGL